MFALFYTLGNLINISISCFLWGQCAQLKAMVACHRLFATCLYFAMMGLTVCILRPTKPMIYIYNRLNFLSFFLLFVFPTKLFCAFYQGPGYTDGARIGAVIGCMIAQFLASCWYSLSFIPFARTIIKNCCKSCCKSCVGLG